MFVKNTIVSHCSVSSASFLAIYLWCRYAVICWRCSNKAFVDLKVFDSGDCRAVGCFRKGEFWVEEVKEVPTALIVLKVKETKKEMVLHIDLCGRTKEWRHRLMGKQAPSGCPQYFVFVSWVPSVHSLSSSFYCDHQISSHFFINFPLFYIL